MGCASSQFNDAKSSRDLTKINNFINTYKSDKDQEIEQYVSELKTIKDRIIWEKKDSEGSVESYASYLSLNHIPKNFVNEAKIKFDQIQFEKALLQNYDGLTYYNSVCKGCNASHRSMIKKSICEKILATRTKTLVSFKKQSKQKVFLKNHCSKLADQTINLKSKQVLILSADEKTFFDKSDVIFGKSCRINGELNTLAKDRYKKITQKKLSQLTNLSDFNTFSKSTNECGISILGKNAIVSKLKEVVQTHTQQVKNGKSIFIDLDELSSIEDFSSLDYCQSAYHDSQKKCKNPSSLPLFQKLQVSTELLSPLCNKLNDQINKCKTNVNKSFTRQKKGYLKRVKTSIVSAMKSKDLDEAETLINDASAKLGSDNKFLVRYSNKIDTIRRREAARIERLDAIYERNRYDIIGSWTLCWGDRQSDPYKFRGMNKCWSNMGGGYVTVNYRCSGALATKMCCRKMAKYKAKYIDGECYIGSHQL